LQEIQQNQKVLNDNQKILANQNAEIIFLIRKLDSDLFEENQEPSLPDLAGNTDKPDKSG
jgi:hypothetical protein